jgi:hypothetical protein
MIHVKYGLNSFILVVESRRDLIFIPQPFNTFLTAHAVFYSWAYFLPVEVSLLLLHSTVQATKAVTTSHTNSINYKIALSSASF